MREIYLSPHCDDVSIKSNESEGVSFDWADRHIGECVDCAKYHRMVSARMLNEPRPRTISETKHEISPGRLSEISSELAWVNRSLSLLVGSTTPLKRRIRFEHEDEDDEHDSSDFFQGAVLNALEDTVNREFETVRTLTIEYLTSERERLMRELKKEVAKA